MGKTKSRGRRAEKKAIEITEKLDLEVNDKTQTLNTTFYGLVDSNELAYFKQAEQSLNINAFGSDSEKEEFATSVLEEAKGKELKLVTNQICSKLMERLILLANETQLKELLRSFSKHFFDLSHHKYSSHVLETLLVRSASIIEKELAGSKPEEVEEGKNPEARNSNDSMEAIFLSAVNDLKPHFKYMITDSYSSHVLRLIILIISGKELPSTTVSNSVLRSKKSKVARKMIEIKDNKDFNRAYSTPVSFKNELMQACNIIREGEDKRHMRELSVHRVGSPVIQLLVQVEGIVDKERSLWFLIFDNNGKEQQEEAFVEHLLSDSIGSHFLESVVKNPGVRLSYIDRIYRLYIKERVSKLARRSTTGAYVINALMSKLKPSEVEFILDQLIPNLSDLLEISDLLYLVEGVINASQARSYYRKDDIIEHLLAVYAPKYSKDKIVESDEFIENILKLKVSTLGNTRDDWPTSEEKRRSLFIEKLIRFDSRLLICLWKCFLNMPKVQFIQMCSHGVFSHVIQEALVVRPNETKEELILRKRILNLFSNEIVDLVCNSYGSHIVDKLWDFTFLLPMYKDRIATELLEKSHRVKESVYGKLVWKNWSMELFVRKRNEWRALIKQQLEDMGEIQRRPIDNKIDSLLEQKGEIKINEKRHLPSDSNTRKRKKLVY